MSDSKSKARTPAGADGLGGVFFRCEDPEATKQWYQRHLGMVCDDWGSVFLWRKDDKPSEKGWTQWSPFKADTDYFGNRDQQFMINYRVKDLAQVVEQMREAGVEIVGDILEESYGRFAHVIDHDGRRIELWEPGEETS
jgi:predicted enzyme related to lactoylglutathione lyase